MAFLPQRLARALIGTFGLGLLLTAVGRYGALSYTVGQRTCEIGIRVAVGASRGAVLGLVVRQGTILLGPGSALGLAVAFAATRLLSRGPASVLLMEVSPTDPATFVYVLLLLAAVALLACFVPARRAAAVDPATALRS